MSDKINLNNNTVDYTVAVLKGASGIVPFAGQALGELVAQIPGQRFDRFQAFLKILDERLKTTEMSLEELRTKFTNEGFFELYEEACEQAAKTNSEDRRKYLAGIIAKGLTSEEIEIQESQHLLRLLGELNDIEILVLRSYWNDLVSDDREFRQKYQNIVYPPATDRGSSQEDFDKAAIHKSYRSHLTSLGLLAPKYKERNEKMVVMDRKQLKEKTQKVETNEIAGYKITSLGNLFLYHVEIVNSRYPY